METRELLLQVLTADLVFGFLIVIVAGIARGFTGFVAGLVNVALLARLYGPVEAIALTSLFGIVSSVLLLRCTIGHIQWNDVVPLCAAAAIAAPAGIALLLIVDPSTVEPAIGAMIIACGAALVTGWSYSGPRNGIVATTVGTICGGVTGLTGSGGPLMVFYYLASPDPVPVQRANISATVFVLGLVMTIALLLSGGMDQNTVLRAAFLFPGTMIGTWTGMKLFEIAPDRIYRVVAQGALIVMGAAVLLS